MIHGVIDEDCSPFNCASNHKNEGLLSHLRLVNDPRHCMQGRLSSANLGDSGFIVLAEKQEHDSVMQIKYHSPQQEHQFGFPYQLGHHENADSVDDAMLMTLPV